jgi:hypothetical protein
MPYVYNFVLFIIIFAQRLIVNVVGTKSTQLHEIDSTQRHNNKDHFFYRQNIKVSDPYFNILCLSLYKVALELQSLQQIYVAEAQPKTVCCNFCLDFRECPVPQWFIALSHQRRVRPNALWLFW